MLLLDVKLLAIVAAVTGLVSHLTYFIHGEHHMKAPILGRLYLGVFIMIYILELLFCHCSYSTAAKNASTVLGSYTIALFGSIVIYRTCFHQLRSFPGPYGAKLSKLWHSWKARYSTNHLLLEDLHQKYGAFVRTGPAEITAFTAEALFVVNAPGSACEKPDWYDNILPMKSLINIRKKEEHDQRRKIWDKAFSVKALTLYEPRIKKYCEQLEMHLALTTGQPINVNDWFCFFSFDVMGDLAFNKSFNMLIDKRWHHSIIMMREFMSLQGPFSPVPWLCRFGFGLPWMATRWERWKDYCRERMRERILTEVTVPDISSFLIAASKENDSLEADRDYLEGDALGIIVAGSDTTAISLVYIFYHLAQYPAYQEQIRNEIQSIPTALDISALQKLQILKSVINETLRLFPPVPTAAGRLSPEGGITIEGRFIPPGTVIFAPRYSIARLESAFEKAHEFIPERWTTRPEMIRDKRGFAAFSQGRFGCIGKGLAMKTMTYLIKQLVLKYDIEFAPGESGMKLWTGMKDDFTAAPGNLKLVFKVRNLSSNS